MDKLKWGVKRFRGLKSMGALKCNPPDKAGFFINNIFCPVFKFIDIFIKKGDQFFGAGFFFQCLPNDVQGLEKIFSARGKITIFKDDNRNSRLLFKLNGIISHGGKCLKNNLGENF